MQHKDALKGIESAAAGLLAERDRIIEALERLRATVEVLDPEYTMVNGALHRISTIVDDDPMLSRLGVDEEPDEVPIPFVPGLEAQPQRRPVPEPVPEPDVPPEGPDPEPDPTESIHAILDWLLGAGPKLQVEVEKQFPQIPRPLVNKILHDAVTTRVLKRDQSTSFRYQHKLYSPKVTTTKEPSPPGRGSGTRQDTAGRVSQSRPSVPERASGDDRGLARSPKPRSEMKEQQREAEERLDRIIEWARDQEGGFTPLDAIFDLYGVEKATTASSNALRGKIGKDFRELAERGLLEATGFAHPKFKESWNPAERPLGRTSPLYKPGRLFPKADPAPPTQEAARVDDIRPVTGTHGFKGGAGSGPRVEPIEVTAELLRDKMIEHKHGYIGEICEWVGVDNSAANRELVALQLGQLARRGIVSRRPSQDGEPACWEYAGAPIDEGAAARLDRQRREPAPERAVASEVAGTGRGIRVGNKEVQTIVDAALRKWPGSVEFLSKHIRVKLPEGGNVTIAHTPNQRGLLRDKAKLRKAGLALA